MKNRRDFLKLGAAATASLAVPGCHAGHKVNRYHLSQPRQVRRALVLWYSQTGNTERIGRLMAAVWDRRGVNVVSSEIRDFDRRSAAEYDFIAVGSPVNHYDAPQFIKDWLEELPRLQGTPVASFVTHGMPPSNQHNTACALLEILAKKGGAPIGMATFGNMGTYPPSWAFFPEETLKSSAYPNEETYDRARGFAAVLLETVEQGGDFEFRREWSFGDVKKNLAPVWFSKLITDDHSIDSSRCQRCGTCAEKCPTGAINPYNGKVNKEICVDCMGCINNCPVQAVRIVYWGKKLVGYRDFLNEHGIEIHEPEELRKGWKQVRTL